VTWLHTTYIDIVCNSQLLTVMNTRSYNKSANMVEGVEGASEELTNIFTVSTFMTTIIMTPEQEVPDYFQHGALSLAPNDDQLNVRVIQAFTPSRKLSLLWE